MKNYKQLLSIITATLLIVPSNIVGMTASATAHCANGECSFENELPEWIPTDFESSMEFERKYGATHIEDGFVCCIHKMYGGESVYRQFVAGYSCNKVSIPYLDRTFELADGNIDYTYSVKIFKPDPTDEFRMLWENQDNDEIDQLSDWLYSFTTDENGVIEETDKFAWLPDCLAEAKQYKEEFGTISSRDKFIACCDIGNFGTGYSSKVKTSGIEDIYEETYIFSDPQIESLDGGEYAKVSTYESGIDGTMTLTFTKGRDFEPEEKHEKIVKYFRFDDDVNVTEISENELDEVLLGDCNYDKKFSLADVVLLQKYLIGKFNLSNSKNADVNCDGVIDVFDLVKIRKMLLSSDVAPKKYTFDEKGPMLLSLYDNYTSLDCVHYQYMTIYTGDGKSYTLNYNTMEKYGKTNLYDKLFSFSDYNWYGALLDLMNNENAEVEESALKPEVFEKTKEMSANLNNYYEDKEIISKQISYDVGNKTLYIIGADDTGKPEAYGIFSSGDVAYIKKNETVQDYVKFLYHNTKLIDANYLRPLIGSDFFYE